jgi:nicotinate-nucleotide pyrophosphorylase (carboxylating)
LTLLDTIARTYDPQVQVEHHMSDGDRMQSGDRLATISGNHQSILKIERVALNFLGHLSGIATQTAAFVERIQPQTTKVVDTRKTLPGWRGLQKYAVACGGGSTHRMGLFDAVLIKDNHLAGITSAELTQRLEAMIDRARDEYPRLKFVMVEVDTLEQLGPVLAAGPDLVLLDNMPPAILRQAVQIRDDQAPAVQLEASGGVTLETVADIAASGVDRVSIGALTHSVTNLDIGLDIA